jgi:hypothetical protein
MTATLALWNTCDVEPMAQNMLVSDGTPTLENGSRSETNFDFHCCTLDGED